MAGMGCVLPYKSGAYNKFDKKMFLILETSTIFDTLNKVALNEIF